MSNTLSYILPLSIVCPPPPPPPPPAPPPAAWAIDHLPYLIPLAFHGVPRVCVRLLIDLDDFGRALLIPRLIQCLHPRQLTHLHPPNLLRRKLLHRQRRLVLREYCILCHQRCVAREHTRGGVRACRADVAVGQCRNPPHRARVRQRHHTLPAAPHAACLVLGARDDLSCWQDSEAVDEAVVPFHLLQGDAVERPEADRGVVAGRRKAKPGHQRQRPHAVSMACECLGAHPVVPHLDGFIS
mmetsp:Transcript_38981/g.79803  ORF Transcript_38981/g.79803 Transcript_38981/m.79803 type:complete len:241 (-) Transcript_38981:677-1399(-)